MSDITISNHLTRHVWEKLNATPVPIVTGDEFERLDYIVDNLNKIISTSEYVPGNTYGYLGIEKKHGATRFIPIINPADTAVYYQLCGEIGEVAIKKLDGVFGGWQVVPTNASQRDINKNTNVENLDNHTSIYFSETLSPAAWFQNYKNFTSLLDDLVSNGNFGDYVGITDVANFYDSIDIEKLIKKIELIGSIPDYKVSLLRMILKFWNRRLNSYNSSNNGIPQEIISDASRNLSHFYLDNIDQSMIDYCSSNEMKYVRWADDFAIFGPSKQRIEAAIFHLSQLLLRESLNLNSGKTAVMSRTNFFNYRALGLIRAINQNNEELFDSELRKCKGMLNRKLPLKIDTVLRSSISYMGRKSDMTTSGNLLFANDILKENRELFSSLSSQHMLNFIELSDDALAKFNEFLRLVNNRRPTSHAASFLRMMREKKMELLALGISKNELRRAVTSIEKSHAESTIIKNYCAPKTSTILNG